MRHLTPSVIILVLALPLAVEAATSNSVSLQNSGGCGGTPSVSFSESGTIDVNINDGAFGCTMSVDGYAGGGAVGVRGTLNHVPGSFGYAQIGASANSSENDISLTPLFDVNDPRLPHNMNYLVNVTLNAALEGTLTAIVDNPSVTPLSGNNILNASATLSAASGTAVRNFSGGSGATGPGPMSSDSEIINGTLTPSLTLDWRFPFSVTFNISASAGATGGGGSTVTSTFDALNSLSFSKTGPAFIVPEGFTVNAPELNIFDNQWIDPRPVPLPAALPLLLGGIGVLSLLRRGS